MSIIRRVTVVSGTPARVIPPDGEDHDGQIQWTVINPTGSGGAIELVDESTKTAGQGFPMAAGATPWQTLAQNEAVYAITAVTSPGVTFIVAGTEYGD